MNPQGPDAHYEVLDFIIKNHRLPRTNELFLACHPPLYYLTSLPFYVIGGLKLVEFYGLITSCLNLWLMAKLVKMTIKDVEIRNLSFLLATFLILHLHKKERQSDNITGDGKLKKAHLYEADDDFSA